MTKKTEKKSRDHLHIVTENDSIAARIVDALGENFSFIRSRRVADAISSMTFQIPAMIISESVLPDMAGIDFLKIIRHSIKTKLIPFLIISETDSTENRIRAIEAGADAYLIYPFMPEELNVLVTSRLNKFREFYLLSITDELTRLYNRREFIKKFNELMSEKKQRTISLGILDIDRFKLVNDIYGHQTGDLVLMKLADILMERTSSSFFPARFGGEEFVILFPGLAAQEAAEIMKLVLEDFASIKFDTAKSVFSVTFSGGVAEYPLMASNVSELLSRADQALYAAKHEGRNRIYLFSPIMARNDKFWDHLNERKAYFVNENGNNRITDLPYLPHLLETIVNLDFPVRSIGVMVIRPTHVIDISGITGYSNFNYDMENFRFILKKASEMVFPSDIYMGISDFYRFEIAVLFPSVADFSFNLAKFRKICGEIIQQVLRRIEDYNIDIHYATDVMLFNENHPEQMIKDFNRIREQQHPASSKSAEFSKIIKKAMSPAGGKTRKGIFELKKIKHVNTLEDAFFSLSIAAPYDKMHIIAEVLNPIPPDELAKIFKNTASMIKKEHNERPLLIPMHNSMDPDKYIEIVNQSFVGIRTVIMIDEFRLLQLVNSLSRMIAGLPDNLSIGVSNTYIGSDILNYISLNDFSLISLSTSIVRNLHYFKDRIQILNGLKIFTDQIGVPLIAQNVSNEEEFHIMRDLNISYVSGSFIDELSLRQ
jgi:diguanylate cyclase (GGDEF)-like protein